MDKVESKALYEKILNAISEERGQAPQAAALEAEPAARTAEAPAEAPSEPPQSAYENFRYHSLQAAEHKNVRPDQLANMGSGVSRFVRKVVRKLTRFYIRPSFDKQTQFNESVGHALETLAPTLEHRDARLTDAEARLDQLGEYIGDVNRRLGEISLNIGAFDTRLKEGMQAIIAQADFKLDAMRLEYYALSEKTGGMQEYLDALQQQVNGLITGFNEVGALRERVQGITEWKETRAAELPYDRYKLSRIDEWLGALYYDLENAFRGTREQILERLEAYKPFLQDCVPLKHGFGILDLGCGRGEWLELVGKLGYEARGIDLNERMVGFCQAIGLDVKLGDAILEVENLETASMGIISGFQIAEHLPFEVLFWLMTECSRALAPGGLLILETPNPENMRVSSCTFYADPSHKAPLLPDTLAFFASKLGFESCDIFRQTRRADRIDTGNAAVDEVLEFANTERDFALVARKPLA